MESKNELYVSPSGLRFRLLAYYSGRIIYTHKGWVICSDADSIPPDQGWFTLLPAEEGYYYIQSTVKHDDECVLSTIWKGMQRCWALPMTKQENEHMHFKFEAGTGRYKGCFRLISRADLPMILAPLRPKEEADERYNNNTRVLQTQIDRDGKNPEQYFSFVFDDTEIINVEFEVSAGKILHTKPELILSNVVNKTKETAKLTANIRKRDIC